jgi:DNA adenine methylase
MKQPSRPLVRYHGGKWKLADWIIGHFPNHRVYVEPFGGGGSVLLRKPRCYAEIYNDMDGEIVNLFRVARDRGDELTKAISLTPFARDEFVLSYQDSPADPLEQARRTLVRSFMGFGSAAVCGQSSGFRANSNRSGTAPAMDWRNFPSALPATIERLQGVVIENRQACQVMAAHDCPAALHYCDPPYVHDTRQRGNKGAVKSYKHEMTDDQHREFAEFVCGLSGMVIVSGYSGNLYDELFGDWLQVGKAAHADGARDRVEVLWMNRAAADQQMRLIA